MQTEMRTTAAGPNLPSPHVLLMGKVYDLPPELAKPMIEGGYAHAVRRNDQMKWERIPSPVIAETPAKK